MFIEDASAVPIRFRYHNKWRVELSDIATIPHDFNARGRTQPGEPILRPSLRCFCAVFTHESSVQGDPFEARLLYMTSVFATPSAADIVVGIATLQTIVRTVRPHFLHVKLVDVAYDEPCSREIPP